MLLKNSCLLSKRGSKKRLRFVTIACIAGLTALSALFAGCVSRANVENPEITFTIIQTNGQKEPASMASFIKEERARSENLVLVDNAGFYEPSGFSAFCNTGSLAEPLKKAYKILGYDAVFAEKPYVIKTLGEKNAALKVGIVAGVQSAVAMQATSSKISASAQQAASVQASSQQAAPTQQAAASFAKLQKTVQKLRSKEKCGVILLLLNAGEESAAVIAENVPGIDMILCGGTNPKFFEPWKVKQTLIASVKDSGRFAGKAEVTVKGSRISELNWENIEINAKNFPPDEEIAAIMAPYKQEYEQKLKKPLFRLKENLDFGRRDCRKYDTRLGGFIADMQEQFVENLVKPVDKKAFFPEKIDFSVINGGIIRGGLEKGEVTAEDIRRILPFEHFLYVVQLKGSAVQKLFEEAAAQNQGADGFLQVSSAVSLSLEYDETGRNGKLLQVLIDGAPVDPEKTYTVAVNDFLLNGGDGYTAFQSRLYEYNTRVPVSEAVAAAAANLAATSSGGALQTEVSPLLQATPQTEAARQTEAAQLLQASRQTEASYVSGAAPQNGARIQISGGISD